jgi:hypothetical protein
MQSVKFLPGDEPGKHRLGDSGINTTRPTPVVDFVQGALAAIDSGDVKSAQVYVTRAILKNQREGKDAGMPAEAPEQRHLHEAAHWLDQAATDIMLEARVTHPHYLSRAQALLWRAREVAQ